uniref:Coatomer subunit zeta n=1 Tax=Angiostrongylus cantonensis TaxID=6313 RepID=A0A0K0DCD9_ANGCA
MVSFVLVEAESHEVLMELIQYLTGNSLKFTVAADIRRLFARTYLDVEGTSAGDVTSSSGDMNPVRSSLINVRNEGNEKDTKFFEMVSRIGRIGNGTENQRGRSDINVPSTAPQFHTSMSNLFGVTPKSEPSEAAFGRWPIVTEALTTEVNV